MWTGLYSYPDMAIWFSSPYFNLTALETLISLCFPSARGCEHLSTNVKTLVLLLCECLYIFDLFCDYNIQLFSTLPHSLY